jgi:polysaccharide export outer membrane protein
VVKSPGGELAFMLSIRNLVLIIGLGALAGCGTTPAPPAVHTSLVSHYVLDASDELRIIVFGQTELSNTFVVDKAGYIAMPLIGAVAARGRTTEQLEGDIAQKLAKNFVRNPDVSVEVSRYRPFFVMGEVAAGGQYAYVPGLTVQQAVAVAGGFTPRANRAHVYVTRQINGQVATAPLGLSDPVRPGDTIAVRERFF